MVTMPITAIGICALVQNTLELVSVEKGSPRVKSLSSKYKPFSLPVQISEGATYETIVVANTSASSNIPNPMCEFSV